MRKLSPETEEKLLSVIEKTAELVETGESPNDAIVKAAADAGLRPSEVSLVVNAYNVGQTTRQRNEAADLHTKLAAFELADTEVILERLYPTNVKTAAALAAETAIAAEYQHGPENMLSRRERLEKQARVIDWHVIDGQRIEMPPPAPAYRDPVIKEANRQLANMQRELSEHEREAIMAFTKLSAAIDELGNYFRSPTSVPLPTVTEAASLLHGRTGELIMAQVGETYPVLEKLAQHRQPKMTVADIDCTAMPFPLLQEAIRRVDIYTDKQAAYNVHADACGKGAARRHSPFFVKRQYVDLTGKNDSATSYEKQALGLDTIGAPLRGVGMYSAMQKGLDNVAGKLQPDTNDLKVQQTVSALNDPGHEDKLRAINSRATLQDLMLNDDVVAGYDPDEVAAAYNDITQLAPSIADQRMLLQTLLRKRLMQGSLDTFEQDQMLKFDKQLRNSQGTPNA